MEASEQVVASLLKRDGFWVRSWVKVDLTKEEKRKIGRHSADNREDRARLRNHHSVIACEATIA